MLIINEEIIMEHLFKLKKDGKTVGYLKFEKVGFSIAIYLTQTDLDIWYPLWKMHYEGSSHSYEFIVGKKSIYIIFDSIHPFVTKDKNGMDVFADDLVWFGWMGKKSKAKLVKTDLFNKLISCKGEVQGLPRTFCKSDRFHIELIEEE